MEITVQSGDTLTSLARDTNQTAQAIADASKIGLNSILNVGQKLTVPDAPMPTPTTEVVTDVNGSEDVLIDKAIEIQTAEDRTPGLGNLQLQEKREEAKYITRQGSKSTEADKVAAQNYLDSQGRVQPEIEPIVMPADSASKQIAREETKYLGEDTDNTPIEQVNIIEELKRYPRQGPNLSTEQAEINFTPDNSIPNAKPATAEGTGGIVETSLTSTAEKDSDGPPTDVVLAALIKAATPQERKASDVYTQVIKALGDQDFTSTVDAKELYQQLSDDVARDTKKIDDSIAAIAEEKIKPTFKGFDKFLAVLGAALGSYGSAMTGTPNFALNIINKAIDADAQQFLASQEIRTKSLLEQRQAVLQRRTDLLQLGINQADRTLKAAQGQRDNQLKIAQVQKIKDDVIAAQDKVIQTFNSGLVELYTDKIAAQKLAKAVQKKDELGREIEATTLKDGKGELHDMPAYLAKTPGEGAELRKVSGFGSQIQDVLNRLDALADKEGELPLSALGPKTISDTRTKVRALANELIIKLKDFYGMGANFTEYEQELIQALTPTDKWLEKWGMWKVKSNNLRDTIVRTHRSMAAAQGAAFTKMPNAVDAKKRDFIKAGVAR